MDIQITDLHTKRLAEFKQQLRNCSGDYRRLYNNIQSYNLTNRGLMNPETRSEFGFIASTALAFTEQEEEKLPKKPIKKKPAPETIEEVKETESEPVTGSTIAVRGNGLNSAIPWIVGGVVAMFGIWSFSNNGSNNQNNAPQPQQSQSSHAVMAAIDFEGDAVDREIIAAIWYQFSVQLKEDGGIEKPIIQTSNQFFERLKKAQKYKLGDGFSWGEKYKTLGDQVAAECTRIIGNADSDDAVKFTDQMRSELARLLIDTAEAMQQ